MFTLSERYPCGMTRTFCIPEQAVAASSSGERILLLLAAALMESFGIRCLATNEPAYAAYDVASSTPIGMPSSPTGSAPRTLVRGRHRQSLKARRLHRRTPVRRGALGRSRRAPPGRALGNPRHPIFGLGWPWVTRRCGELSNYGLAGLMETRSRLLSLAGAERACGFVGDLRPASRCSFRNIQPSSPEDLSVPNTPPPHVVVFGLGDDRDDRSPQRRRRANCRRKISSRQCRVCPTRASTST